MAPERSRSTDDYYSPDVNSNVIPLPGVTTPTGLACSAVPDPNGGAWTDSFQNIKCYDTLKVNAILNEIGGTEENTIAAHQASRPARRNSGSQR